MKMRPRTTTTRPPHMLPTTSLSRCGADYLAACRARNLSERTIAHYKRSLILFSECLPTGQTWHTSQAVRQAVGLLRERPQYSKASLSMYLRAWRSFLRFCQTEELITEDLARHIKPPKSEPRRDTILDTEAAQRLIDAACAGYNGVRDMAMLTLMFDTGVRAGELVALTVANVDLGSRTVTVPSGKTGGRSVPDMWRAAHSNSTPPRSSLASAVISCARRLQADQPVMLSRVALERRCLQDWHTSGSYQGYCAPRFAAKKTRHPHSGGS